MTFRSLSSNFFAVCLVANDTLWRIRMLRSGSGLSSFTRLASEQFIAVFRSTNYDSTLKSISSIDFVPQREPGNGNCVVRNGGRCAARQETVGRGTHIGKRLIRCRHRFNSAIARKDSRTGPVPCFPPIPIFSTSLREFAFPAANSTGVSRAVPDPVGKT